jgi:leucyl-tRNA synthetase
MSKSKGNVVDPKAMMERYGADACRLFILFAAPPEMDLEWSDQGVEGVYRFLSRVWRVASENISFAGKDAPDTAGELRSLTHRTIKKVGEDIARFNFNTAISAIMELVNGMSKYNEVNTAARDSGALREATWALTLLVAPFAPHLAEELWEAQGAGSAADDASGSVHSAGWPAFDPALIVSDTITLIVQVNGKLRDRLDAPAAINKEEMEQLARASANVLKYVDGKEIVKVIAVPGKLINIVTK